MRLLLFESINLVYQRRWLVIFPVLTVITLFAIDSVSCRAENLHMVVNIWDGPCAVFFNTNYFIFAIILMFVVIVSSSLIRDLSNSYQLVVFTRAKRLSWLNAKIGAIFFAALIYVLIGVLVILIVSAFFFPWGSSFSQFAIRPGLGQQYYYYLSSTSHPVTFFGAMCLYTAFAFTVFMLIPLVLSLITKRNQIIIIIPLALLVLSRLGVAFLPLSYLQYDLVTRLSFIIHYVPMPTVPFTLSSSLLYLGCLGIVGWLIGAFAVLYSDI
jgi:hypothetical protein